ncbi:MAG: DNA topology modulation protein, partial [Kiritimatiellae bacterium]|nr:DNA topology modulation protein [Kiritimatiellia bacterium]
MKRIMLIGSGGAGKSTLAREMGEILDLPVIHLDRLHWKPNWESTPKEEWGALQEKICAEPEWIIDGNYGATMKLRLAACDTIVFLDLPRWLCLLRVVKRFLTYRGKSRPDMTEGCEERFDRAFLLWIWRYRKDKRPGILKMLS